MSIKILNTVKKEEKSVKLIQKQHGTHPPCNSRCPTLKPVGHQSTNSMLLVFLMFWMAEFTSFGTTSPRKSSVTAMYLPLRGLHFTICMFGEKHSLVSSAVEIWKMQMSLRSLRGCSLSDALVTWSTRQSLSWPQIRLKHFTLLLTQRKIDFLNESMEFPFTAFEGRLFQWRMTRLNRKTFILISCVGLELREFGVTQGTEFLVFLRPEFSLL